MNIEVTGFKSVHIQEIIDQSYNEMIESCALTPGKPLKFCNGFLLDIAGFDPSDEMKNNEANGIYRFQIVYLAEAQATYRSVIKHTESNTDIPVYDMSKSEFYSELVEYCKNYITNSNTTCNVCKKVHRAMQDGQCCMCGKFHDVTRNCEQ